MDKFYSIFLIIHHNRLRWVTHTSGQSCEVSIFLILEVMEFSLFYDNTILNDDNSAAFLNCCESVSDDDRSPVKPLLCFFTFPSSTLFCRL